MRLLAIAFGAAVAGGLCEPAGAVVMQASYSGTVFDAHDATDIFDTGGALNGSAFELLFIFDPDTPGIERETDAMHDYARGGSDRGLASQIRSARLTINAHTVSVDGRDAANALTDVASGMDDTPGFVSQGFFRRSVMGDLLDQRVFGVTMHGPAGTFAPDLEASIPFTTLFPVATFAATEGSSSHRARGSSASARYSTSIPRETCWSAHFRSRRSPSPAALPLLASGLAVLGLAGLRRRRGGQPVAA